MPIKLVTIVTRIVKKDVTTLAGMAVLTACGSSGTLGVKDSFRSLGDTATPVVLPVAAPVAAPAAPAAPAPALATGAQLKLGVNVGSVDYWNGDRAFANLLVGSPWLATSLSGWPEIDRSRLDANNYPKSIANGEVLALVLTPPAGVLTMTGVQIRCTFEGSAGYVDVQGTITAKKLGDHVVDFFWPGAKLSDQRVWLEVHGSGSASDPIRNLDCREANMARADLFASEYLDGLKPFKVLRFLDMSGVNGNPTVTWAERTLPQAVTQVGRSGVALENLVAMANSISADAWFNIPWNADEDYVTKMAQTVHDNIGSRQHVYVEMSNEVWNYAFGVAKQAENEGVQEGLSTDRFEALLRRYAEKSTWAMKIWTKVFADRPGQLVRVVGAQHPTPWTAETILNFGDTANWVDALATAPYFGYDLFSTVFPNSTDLNVLFPGLEKEANNAISGEAVAQKAVAKKFGKRYIAYEAGQHLLNPSNVGVLAAMNRDDRMYTIYKSYLANWRTQIGDVMMLFQSTAPIGPWGAWGLREYTGQPLSETPKRRAVLEDVPAWNG